MNNTVAVFDIGKTNKKLLLFNDRGEVVFENAEQLPEIKDEDGFPCEDILFVKNWMLCNWKKILSDSRFLITAVNVTSYGASLVHLDEKDEPLTPLYSYLKPFPDILKKLFQETYGNISLETDSPSMGMLNSGFQLYWLKKCKPEYFKRIKTTLHLPQYLSFLITGKKYTEYTSMGCHTALWDFEKSDYHSWIYAENFDILFPTLISNPLREEIAIGGRKLLVGSGLHDSSSSLLPYIEKYIEPFILISTGTWCINLNPFNQCDLTVQQLSSDCLSYLTPFGKKVIASRVFIGMEHEFQVKRIAKHFGVSEDFFLSLSFDCKAIENAIAEFDTAKILLPTCMEGTGPFSFSSKSEWNLSPFSNNEEAYVQLMLDMSCMVYYSVKLIEEKSNCKIFIDGGFAANEIFVNLIATHFLDKEVLISYLPQATALGAAIAVGMKTDTIVWEFKAVSSSSFSLKLQEYTKRVIEFYRERGF